MCRTTPGIVWVRRREPGKVSENTTSARMKWRGNRVPFTIHATTHKDATSTNGSREISIKLSSRSRPTGMLVALRNVMGVACSGILIEPLPIALLARAYCPPAARGWYGPAKHRAGIGPLLLSVASRRRRAECTHKCGYAALQHSDKVPQRRECLAKLEDACVNIGP